MILEPRPGRYRLHGLDSPEAEAVLAEVGITRADLDRALAELERTRGHPDPQHRRHQRRRRVRLHARGLAPGPARRLQGALRAAALAQGPGAARPRARGQHRTVPRGRHPAGLIGPHLRHLRRRGRAPGGDLFEAPAVALQHRLLPCPLLPAPHDHVAVLRIELHQPRLRARPSRRRSAWSPSRRTGPARCPGSCSSS